MDLKDKVVGAGAARGRPNKFSSTGKRGGHLVGCHNGGVCEIARMYKHNPNISYYFKQLLLSQPK